MKKLKLSLSNMEGVEVLTREQLKKVMGGSGTGPCESDAECVDGIDIECNGTIIHSGPGRCYDSGNGRRCHYAVGC